MWINDQLNIAKSCDHNHYLQVTAQKLMVLSMTNEF